MNQEKQKYKMVAMDLDDTLLTTDKRITEGNRAALKACLDQGIRVVTASGRFNESQLAFVKQLDLNLEHQLQVGDGGGTLFNQDGIYELLGTFKPQTFASILEQARTLALPCFVSNGRNVYYDIEEQPLLEVYNKSPDSRRDYIYKIKDLGQIEKPQKFVFYFETEDDYAYIRRIIAPGTVTIRVGRNLIEITDEHMNKHNALKRLCALEGIAMEQVVTIGDSENDIPMLAGAGLGLAMANALDNVKLVADFVGERTNDEDGVAALLEAYVL